MKASATILVVDDRRDLLRTISFTLEKAGYRVLTAGDGVDALRVLGAEPVDVILADIAMPGLNGYQLYERVRENPDWVAIPFLFLTARAFDSDIRYGKSLGVDDYLTKPIQPEDLLAAIEGKLVRARQLVAVQPAAVQVVALQAAADEPPGQGHGILDFGQVRVAPGQYQVWRDGEKVELSAREFRLLETMTQRAGMVVPLSDLIWVTHGLRTDYADAGSLLRPLIRSLRRKLGYPAGELGCIRNVRGVGYRFCAPCPEETSL